MIKAGIIGGAGYTAGELIRILLFHPNTEISYVVSRSHAGEPLSKAHGDLVGDTDIIFSADYHMDVDVIFLCMGHGKSAEFMASNNVPDSVRIVDLSTDFRIWSSDHNFAYGLPEINVGRIEVAKHIANPGCFATCIQLGLFPLANQQLIRTEIHAHAITGSTGAGAGLSPTSHFSWRDSNLSVYKPFTHQHLEEINQTLSLAQKGYSSGLNFIPVRGNFTRGIFASMYTEFSGTEEDAVGFYKDYYKNAPFTHVVDENPNLKQVVNTNKCLIYVQVWEGKLHIISMIDNLLKGASGQAVQNMNIMFGLDQTTGLMLKGTGF